MIAPKGYYDVSETLGLNEQNFIGTFDYATYGDEILNDALNFAKTFIPERVCKRLLLPMQYQSFGVNLYYEFADTKIPFYGEISEKGALQRKETTERYIITITAERGGKKRVATADFRVIGTGDSAFSEVFGRSPVRADLRRKRGYRTSVRPRRVMRRRRFFAGIYAANFR